MRPVTDSDPMVGESSERMRPLRTASRAADRRKPEEGRHGCSPICGASRTGWVVPTQQHNRYEWSFHLSYNAVGSGVAMGAASHQHMKMRMKDKQGGTTGA